MGQYIIIPVFSSVVSADEFFFRGRKSQGLCSLLSADRKGRDFGGNHFTAKCGKGGRRDQGEDFPDAFRPFVIAVQIQAQQAAVVEIIPGSAVEQFDGAYGPGEPFVNHASMIASIGSILSSVMSLSIFISP